MDHHKGSWEGCRELHLLRCVCLSGTIFTSLSHLGHLSSVITLSTFVFIVRGGVSGAKGQDLGLGSKILDSISGVNNSGLTREQSGLSPWRERGHETSVWASGIQGDSERGTQLLNGEQGIWPLGPAVQRVPCKWPHVFHGCPKARMSDLELSIFPTLELGPGRDRVAEGAGLLLSVGPGASP